MGQKNKASFILILAILAVNFCNNQSQKTMTQYRINQIQDAGTELSVEQWQQALGVKKATQLIAGAGLDSLNQLSYGLGSSNAITLLNNVAETNRINQILNGAGSTPAVNATVLVDLVNQIDWHIREGRTVHSSDTLAKIYTLVNSVNTTEALNAIINGLLANGSDPAGYFPIQRLALLVAMTNETSGTVANLLNGVVSPGAVLSTSGRDKLLQIINGTNDILRLTALLNELNSVGITIDIINTLNTTGTNRVLELLNHPNNQIPKLAHLVNNLSSSGALQNSDNFSGSIDGQMPAAIHNWAGWSSVNHQFFYITASHLGPAIAFNMAELSRGKSAVLRNRFFSSSAGTLSFKISVPQFTASSGAVKIFLNGVEQVSYSSPVEPVFSIPVGAGTHDLKILLYSQDGYSGGGAWFVLTDFQAPGTQGANRTSGQKAAILLNMLNIAGTSTVTSLLDGLPYPTTNATPLNNLISILDRVHFPTNIVDQPKMVQLINSLTSTQLLINILNGITDEGSRQLTELINFTSDVNRIVTFVNTLHAANSGKVITVINNLKASGSHNPIGTHSLIDLLNFPVVSIPDLVILINGVNDVSHYTTILNTLAPLHFNIRDEGTSTHYSINANWPGASKLAEILQKIVENPDLTVGQHAVRLSNDLAGGSGAAALAQIINGLDPAAPVETGMIRMTNLIWRLRSFGGFYYDHPYDLTDGGLDHTGGGNAADSSDHFGRLTTLANSITSSGSDTMASMVNYTDYASFPKLEQLVRDVRRIQYLADMANKLQNIQLLTNAIPPVNMASMLEILNDIGNSTQKGSGTKIVGNMDIFAASMNALGYLSNGQPRPLSDQLKIVELINQVDKCGIEISTELNTNPVYTAEKNPACTIHNDRIRKRASNVILGLDSALPLSILAGDVNDINKVVTLMNGMRNVTNLIMLVNLVPPEVMKVVLNEISLNDLTFGNALQRTLLYLLNRLPPPDVARLVHYGTGIGKGRMYTQCGAGFDYWNAGWRDYDTEPGVSNCGGLPWWWVRHFANDRLGSTPGTGCNYYRGVGPKRLAILLNAETGVRLKNVLDKFGVRTATAALGCGLYNSNTSHVHSFTGGYGPIAYVPTTESLAINRPVNTYNHYYGSSTFEACNTSYGGDHNSGSGTWATDNWFVNRRGYFPEILLGGAAGTNPANGGFGLQSYTLDRLVYGNIGAVWGLMNCDGAIGAIACGLGAIPVPPKSFRSVGYGFSADEIHGDCDIVPAYNSTTGATNAVGDGGPGGT